MPIESNCVHLMIPLSFWQAMTCKLFVYTHDRHKLNSKYVPVLAPKTAKKVLLPCIYCMCVKTHCTGHIIDMRSTLFKGSNCAFENMFNLTYFFPLS